MRDEQTGRKRQAFVDELTQPQHTFIFECNQQRELMKRERAEREMKKQKMKQNF